MANVIIPSSPEDRKKVLEALKEFSNSLARIEAEQTLQKEILNRLEDEFELPKKYMRKVARVYHKQNLNEVRAEVSEVEDIYESIVR
jgi:DNA repair ATPase RecN